MSIVNIRHDNYELKCPTVQDTSNDEFIFIDSETNRNQYTNKNQPQGISLTYNPAEINRPWLQVPMYQRKTGIIDLMRKFLTKMFLVDASMHPVDAYYENVSMTLFYDTAKYHLGFDALADSSVWRCIGKDIRTQSTYSDVTTLTRLLKPNDSSYTGFNEGVGPVYSSVELFLYMFTNMSMTSATSSGIRFPDAVQLQAQLMNFIANNGNKSSGAFMFGDLSNVTDLTKLHVIVYDLFNSGMVNVTWYGRLYKFYFYVTP